MTSWLLTGKFSKRKKKASGYGRKGRCANIRVNMVIISMQRQSGDYVITSINPYIHL